jgi:hypothetical protein
MSEAACYKQPPDKLRPTRREAREVETLLLQKLERWEALEEKIQQKAS